MKYLSRISVSSLIALAVACGGGNETNQEGSTNNASESHNHGGTEEQKSKSSGSPTDYDPKRGEGKFTAENLKLSDQLDAGLAAKGKDVSDVKCASCHKMTEERLVGPGWKGVTQRRQPAWLMNFITNPDPMIDKDPELQKQLEICLVRMPNQSLAEEEARSILEFMRQNDGVK